MRTGGALIKKGKLDFALIPVLPCDESTTDFIENNYNDDMFQQQLPLQGLDFTSRYDKLCTAAKRNYAALHKLHTTIKPLPWEDALTREQAGLYSFILKPDNWNKVCDAFAADIDIVPVLSLSVVGKDPSRPDFVLLSTYAGRVAAFSMAALWVTAPARFKEEDIFPEDLRFWLKDPTVFIVVSGLTQLLKNPPPGLECSSVVDTEEVFGLYASTGVIRPLLPPQTGDLAYQAVFTYGYHHRPCRVDAFKTMVTTCKYEHWPDRREVGWLPATDKDKQTRYERSFLYQEAMTPLGFMFKLVRVGLIHGGMAAVQPELPFKDLLKVFCRGNLSAQSRGVAPQADPLNLQSDRPLTVEAPPDSPYSPGQPQESAAYSPTRNSAQEGSSGNTEEETIELHDRDLEQQFRTEKPDTTPQYNVAVPPRFKSRVKMTRTNVPQRPVKERLGKQMPDLPEGESEPPATSQKQPSVWEEGLEVVCLTPGQPVVQTKVKEELDASPVRSYAQQAVDEDWQLRQQSGKTGSRDAATDPAAVSASEPRVGRLPPPLSRAAGPARHPRTLRAPRLSPCTHPWPRLSARRWSASPARRTSRPARRTTAAAGRSRRTGRWSRCPRSAHRYRTATCGRADRSRCPAWPP